MFLSGGLESPLPPAAPVTPASAPRRTASWVTAVATAASSGGAGSSIPPQVPSPDLGAAAPAEPVLKPSPVSLLEIQQAEAAAALAAARPQMSLLSGALKTGRLSLPGHNGGSGTAGGVVGALTHAGDDSLSAGPASERPASGGGNRIPLSQFIQSSPAAPIPEAGAARPAAADAAPAWGGAAGASPPDVSARPSLRDIQVRDSPHIVSHSLRDPKPREPAATTDSNRNV